MICRISRREAAPVAWWEGEGIVIEDRDREKSSLKGEIVSDIV